jgi:adenylate cyclase
MSSLTPTDPWPLPELTRARRAIVVVDVVESVRLMQEDEAGFIDRWRRFVHEVRTAVLPKHGGRLVKSLGDGMLLEFEEAPRAVAAAFAMHQGIAPLRHGLSESSALWLRCGLHVDEVVVDEMDIYGKGVNLAARLAALAGPGENVVSAAFREQVLADFDADMEDLGECYLKHLPTPVRAFRVWPMLPTPFALPTRAAPATELRPVVAVLPFSDRDGSASAHALGDVLADQVIAALSRSSALSVISRLSTHAFRQRNEPLDRVAQALGAHYVLTGDCSHAGGRMHVSVTLSDMRNGAALWTRSLADREGAVLETDSELVATLVNGVAHAIFASEVGSVRSRALPTLQCHTLLIAAISLLYRLSSADFERARAALDTLQERAPRHAAPLAWLARWHLFRVVQGWSLDRRRDGEAALSYAKRALDIDPDSSLALTMLGNVHTSFLRDLPAAQALYDRALAINPNESLAWLQKGNCLSFGGAGSRALDLVQRAVELSPLDPSRHFYLSIMSSAALSARDYERAIQAARASLRLNSEHVSTYRVLAIAQAMSGRLEEARASVTRLMQLEPGLTVEGFVARSPGAASGLAHEFGRALQAAGLPAGTAMGQNGGTKA